VKEAAIALTPMQSFDRKVEAAKIKTKDFEEGLLTLITVSKSQNDMMGPQ